jgi:3-hydroxyacyl-CoA dehydrogenase
MDPARWVRHFYHVAPYAAAQQVVDYRVHEQVAVLTIDSPPVNLLSVGVRQGIASGLAVASEDPEVAAVVITARGRAFIAGADISEFGKAPVEPSLDALFERVEASPKPVIAALDGVALGGGLEVALCCDYRVGTMRAALGLPEVKLGLLPGGGGTQRLPRLIGAERALDLILSGETVSAARAAEIGILDAILTGELPDAALRYARALLEAGAPLRKLRDESARLLVDRGKPELFARAYTHAAARMPGRFAVEMIVQCVEAAVHATSFAAGMEVERRCFQQCLEHPQHAALEHLFFAERGCAKIPEISRRTPSQTIERALIDAQLEAAAASLCERLRAAGVELLCFDPEQPERRASLGRADLVILDRRSRPELLAALPEALAPTATILSFSSEHDLDELAEVAGRPRASVGAELCPSGRVLELVCGEATSPEALATLLKLGKRLGLICVVSRRGTARRQNRYTIGGRLRAACERELGRPTTEASFDDRPTLERCLAAAAAEGQRLLAEGVALRPGDIDVVCVRGHGFPELSGGPMHWAAQRPQNV